MAETSPIHNWRWVPQRRYYSSPQTDGFVRVVQTGEDPETWVLRAGANDLVEIPRIEALVAALAQGADILAALRDPSTEVQRLRDRVAELEAQITSSQPEPEDIASS